MAESKKDDATPLDTSKHVTPNEDTSKEGTPIGDELAKELNLTEVPFTARAVRGDISTALERETQDGKGDEDPGESDWVSYATDDVEKSD